MIFFHCGKFSQQNIQGKKPFDCCLLYTSDAADERSSVDLGGRRIIKKKKLHDMSGPGPASQNLRKLRAHY